MLISSDGFVFRNRKSTSLYRFATAGMLLCLAVAGPANGAETRATGIPALREALASGPDRTALAELIRRAEGGEPAAAYAVGTVYRDGTAVDRDYTAARDFFAQAAFFGNADAMNALGEFYREGLGLSADPVEAYAWFRVAAELGHTAAAANRDALETGLTGETRAAGRALALRRELEIELVARDRLRKTRPLVAGPARTDSTALVANALAEDQKRRAHKAAETQETTSPTATTTTAPGFVVQIGVFARRESIAQIRSSTEELGYNLTELAKTVDGAEAWRLTVGPFADREAADQAAKRIDRALEVTSRVMAAGS